MPWMRDHHCFNRAGGRLREGATMGYRDAIADPWGRRTPFGPGDEWPVRVDQYLVEGVAADEVQRWVRTASRHPGARSVARERDDDH